MEKTETIVNQLNDLMREMAATQKLPYPHPQFQCGYVYEGDEIRRFSIENNRLIYRRHKADWDDEGNAKENLVLIEEQGFSSLNGLAYFYWKDTLYNAAIRLGREQVKQKYAAKFPNSQWCNTLWVNDAKVEDVPLSLLLPEKKQNLASNGIFYHLEMLHFEFSEREFQQVITYHNRCNAAIRQAFAQKVQELDNIIFQAGLNEMLGLLNVPALQNPLSRQAPEKEVKDLSHAREWQRFRQYVKRHFVSVSGFYLQRWAIYALMGILLAFAPAIFAKIMAKTFLPILNSLLLLLLTLICLRPFNMLAERESEKLISKRNLWRKILFIARPPRLWRKSHSAGLGCVLLFALYVLAQYFDVLRSWKDVFFYTSMAMLIAYYVIEAKETA